MRAQTLIPTLENLIRLQRTVCIEGAPGGGKTTVVEQVARGMGLNYIEMHLPTMLVEDFGIPMPTDGILKYLVPDWFPAEGSRHDDGIGGVLCFDDRNQAGADIQKVLANICQARSLHGVKMAKGWTVVSTGNRQQDRAGANRVLSHLRNRETVLNFETHIDDSTTWMIDHDIHSAVISFIRFRPGLLHDFDPQRDCNPSPRAWCEGVSPIIGAVPAEAEYECFSGAVGEGPAAEFVGFLRIYRTLPNPDSIIMNPKTSDVPRDPATLYALSGALAERATNGNFDRVVEYLDRMPPEFSVLAVSMAVKRDDALTNTQAFTKWIMTNKDIMF